MAVVIPKNGRVKVARIEDLTFLRAASSLADLIDSTKAGVKKRMRAAGVRFAQSEFVVADLRGEEKKESKRFTTARKLHEAFVKTERITFDQFLDVLCVRTSLLPDILSGEQIETILDAPQKAAPGEDAGSLYTDWKPGITCDPEVLQIAMTLAVQKQNQNQKPKRDRKSAA